MPVKIHNKDYYTVAERIHLMVEFLGKQEKDYSLNTELISWENGVVIMKATLTLINGESVLTYTGHAYEKEGSSQINKTSALENCETSAIGRALSAAGFGGGNEFASANEVENAIHQQNKTPKKASKTRKNGTSYMTASQEKKIRDLIKSSVLTDTERVSAEGWLSDPNGHTKESASDTINMLTKKIANGLEN